MKSSFLPDTDGNLPESNHSPLEFILILVICLFGSEAMIMVFFYFYLPSIDPILEAFLDPLFLVILAAPVLYFLSYKPLAKTLVRQKKAEENSRRAEQKISAVVKTVGEGVIVIGYDSIIQYANQELLDIFGYSFDEVFGQHVHILMPEKYRERHSSAIISYLAKSSSEEGSSKIIGKRMELEGLRKDGSIFPLEIKIGETRVDSQKQYFTAAIRDISERKKAEKEVSRLVTAISQSEDSIVITDKDGKILYVNPYFERLTGYTSAEVAGQNPRVLKSGKQSKTFYENLWKTISAGKTWRGRFTNRKKNGELFIEDATITPVLDALKEIANFVAVKRDVTASIQLDRQIRQTQKMDAMGRLAGGIAHDFNNILTGIIGYTEISIEDLPENSDSRKSLDKVLKACGRARDLVKQILTFSREAEQELKPMQPHIIVKESLHLIRASLPATIEIKDNIDKNSGIILGDPTQITQVVMNLCTNAEYAMRETGGTLEVSLERVEVDNKFLTRHRLVRKGAYIKLMVSDTGAGIDKVTLEHLLEPFFTTKPKGEGTGMGLSVVHGVVSGHGGALEIISEKGKGSSFHVYLPITGVESVAKDKKTTPIPSGTESVLMVDDEETIILMGEKMLKRLGYNVVSTTSPVKALELFKKSPDKFDVVLTDLTMPVMSGTELATEICGIRNDIPVILCTGYSYILSDEQAEEVGITESIAKPFMRRTLAEAIRRAISKKKNS